jgi:hypothetical protein
MKNDEIITTFDVKKIINNAFDAVLKTIVGNQNKPENYLLVAKSIAQSICGNF